MNVTDFLNADAEAQREDRFHPQRGLGFHDLYVDKADLPLFALVRKAVCAHTWLQTSIAVQMSDIDPRRKAMRVAAERAEECIGVLARELKETDPFLPRPDGFRLSGRDPRLPGDWLHLGLSALALELVLGKAGKIGEPQFAQFHWPLQAMGACFGRERRFALAEAGRLASSPKDPALVAAAKAFELPGEIAWQVPFLKETLEALDGRIPSRRELLKTAIASIREASSIPHDPWTYLEPIIKRHAKTFGIGLKEKLALRAYLAVI